MVGFFICPFAVFIFMLTCKLIPAFQQALPDLGLFSFSSFLFVVSLSLLQRSSARSPQRAWVSASPEALELQRNLRLRIRSTTSTSNPKAATKKHLLRPRPKISDLPRSSFSVLPFPFFLVSSPSNLSPMMFVPITSTRLIVFQDVWSTPSTLISGAAPDQGGGHDGLDHA